VAFRNGRGRKRSPTCSAFKKASAVFVLEVAKCSKDAGNDGAHLSAKVSLSASSKLSSFPSNSEFSDMTQQVGPAPLERMRLATDAGSC